MTGLLPFDHSAVRDVCRELDEWRLRLDARGAPPRRWEGRLRRELEAAAVGASLGLEQVPVTVDEVRRILAGDRPTRVSSDDAALVTGYRDAMSFVLRRADDPSFRWDRELVIGLQDRVLAGRHAEGAGRLRARDAWLTDGASGRNIFRPPPHEGVSALVDEMCAVAEAGEGHPAALSAWVHLACAAIHPFRDGNGRTARVLASLGMYRGDFRRAEFTSLEEWWGRHPADYYAAFSCLGPEFDRGADVTPFVRTHVEAQLSQVRALDLKERVESRIWTAIENVAMDRGLAPRLANALWDVFLGREIVAGYYRELADVSAPTVTTDLAAATAAGLLRAEGQRRGRRYLAGPALMAEVGRALGVEIEEAAEDPGQARVLITRELAERLTTVEQSHPGAIIAGAWRELERALQRATGVGELPATLQKTIRNLSDIRSRVVHAEGPPPKADEAFAYAEKVRRTLRAMAGSAEIDGVSPKVRSQERKV